MIRADAELEIQTTTFLVTFEKISVEFAKKITAPFSGQHRKNFVHKFDNLVFS